MNLNQRHFLLGGGLMTEEKDPGVIRTSVIVINPIPTVKKLAMLPAVRAKE